MIPYGKQDLSSEDIAAVVEVLESDWLTQGPNVPLFEQALANYCNANFGIAVNSATSALHIACLALGVGKNDCVWTSPITFVASANCALYCGASVDFVDIDISSGLMSVEKLAEKLKQASKNNALPKAIIPVHLAGQSCDMQSIKKLADQYNVRLIEDASHAIGGAYQNQKIGGCQFSDITVFSFHPVKIITSAEGGMALTNDKHLAQMMQKSRSHGISNSPGELLQESHGPWYYEQQSLGFNYRMTELQAALGLSQLKRLDEFISKRNALAANYNSAFSELSISHLLPKTNCYSAYHLYIVLLNKPDKQKHKSVITELRAQGITAQVHYIPVHLQPYYQNLGFKVGDFPVAEAYYQQAFSLPLFTKLTDDEQTYVINTMKALI